MEQHDFLQGEQEWHSHRAAHFNASDAPAMLGISQYKSRTQLLREMATGITPDVDEATQRRFDAGHRFEALARPLAEQIIGKKLYPVIGSEGKLSASFDGLTADDSTAFEHKSLNNGLRKALSAGEIPEQYRAQMEQQLMLSGAEKCLFMASSWNDADELIEEMHQWYENDQDMRDRLLQGWTQFAIDLENYVHVEHIEKPKAEVCIELPALFVHAKGEITTHNMDEFGMALTAKLAEVRAIALVTDQDFSNAKEAAKKFRETAKSIALSKEAVLAQTETIGEAARKMDAWAKDLNQTALQLEKDVEREDKAKKEVMILEGRQAYADHVAALESEIKPIRLTLTQPNFAEAIKGKRNYASMHDGIQTMLAGAKIEADAQAKDVRTKLAWCKENAAGQGALFPDLAALMAKPMDDFTLTITSRIEKQKADEAARIEAQRAAMQAEEERKATAKAQAEAEAILAAERAKQAEEEAKAKATQDALLAAERAKMEAEVRAETEAKAAHDAEVNEEIATLKKYEKVDNLGEEPVTTTVSRIDQARVVIDHQDEISAFMRSRDFGKDAGKVRAILVEFVKFQSANNLKEAA